MTLHNELHPPPPSLFSLALLSKRSLHCTGQSASPFYLQKKKTLVATVWSIKLLKERPLCSAHPPPPFIRLPERNIKLSVLPSDRRMEISSLSIKMSRYFISVPVGLRGPGTVHCGSSVLQLSVFSFSSTSFSNRYTPILLLPPSTLAPPWTEASRLLGGGARLQSCTSVGLTEALSPRVRLLISISQLKDWSRMMPCRL